jgi:putative ABC transport system permease protein
MKLRILVGLALQSILKNKTRAMLTMLGIVIGVAAVIVMVAVGYGARSRIHQQISTLGTNMIVIRPGASASGGVSQGAQAFATLTLADADKIRKEAQTVAAVSPVITGRSQVIAKAGNWRTAINGVDTDYQTIRDWQTDAGAFFGPDDVRAARSVAVLGRTVAQRIFGDSDPVGQEIQVAAVRFKVTGVLTAKGQTASGSDSDDVILIPYTTAATRLTGKPRIPQILANTSAEGDVAAAQDEIRTLLRESHHIGGDDEDDFTVRNQTDLATAAESSTRVMTLLMAAIAAISLLVGGIGIMNIMLVSVRERTREIGLRKALGARERDILAQFLIEALTISTGGGLIGLLAGMLVAMLMGGIGGFLPALSAMRQRPLESLR